MSLPETHPGDPGWGDLDQDRFSTLPLSFLPKYTREGVASDLM